MRGADPMMMYRAFEVHDPPLDLPAGDWIPTGFADVIEPFSVVCPGCDVLIEGTGNWVAHNIYGAGVAGVRHDSCGTQFVFGPNAEVALREKGTT